MSPLTVAILSLALSAVNAIGVIFGIRWHCRNDDRRAGIQEERSAENTRRIVELERRMRSE